jgi:hypothetical protein
MTRNKPCDPKHGTIGQNQTNPIGAGGTNTKATPFKAMTSRNNHPKHAAPQYGVTSQRLSGGKPGKATGYPPGYTSR